MPPIRKNTRLTASMEDTSATVVPYVPRLQRDITESTITDGLQSLAISPKESSIAQPARQQEEAERRRQAAAQAAQRGQPQTQLGTREYTIALLQRQVLMELEYMEYLRKVEAASAHTKEAHARFSNEHVAAQRRAQVLHQHLARLHEPQDPLQLFAEMVAASERAKHSRR
ncbi:hypothetical protein BGZ94_004090 [Podila epigama]|nr:hypothetical protein BGZ94_004090 [Podila epigama]